MDFIDLPETQYKKGFRLREFRHNRHLSKTPNNQKWSGILIKKNKKIN